MKMWKTDKSKTSIRKKFFEIPYDFGFSVANSINIKMNLKNFYKVFFFTANDSQHDFNIFQSKHQKPFFFFFEYIM